MPPVQSVPSDEVDDDVAFQVLNQDNLPITVVGEGLLHPFERDGQKQKPNVIVYPTRRLPNNLEEGRQRPFTKSHGHLDSEDYNDYDLGKTHFSVSHGHLNHTNSSKKLQVEDLQNSTLYARFTKTLDAKLRRLQREEKPSGKKLVEHCKKPFVTTVKTGQFLEPPPEIACLLGFKVEEAAIRREEKKLYAYESRPRVLNRGGGKPGHRARYEAAAKNAACLIGGIIGLQDSEDLHKDVNSNISKRSV